MNILITLLVIVMVYLYLIAPRMFGKPERSAFYGVHYAHRGLFDNESDAPENSLAAFRKAVEKGYGIECDVRLTKDGIPVVFHDASLKRMCGLKALLAEYTWKELQDIKLGKSKERIPSLEQVLKVVDGKVPLIIEYKLDDTDMKVCEKGNVILENYPGVYCVESFQPFALLWYRKNRPDIVRGQLSQDFSKTNKKGIRYWILTHLLTNFLTRPDFIAYNHRDAGKLSRRICSKLGAMSVAWTVRSEKQYRDNRTQFDLFIFDSFIMNKEEKE